MRLIRPLNVARLLALLLAFGVFVPVARSEGGDAGRRPRTASRRVAGSLPIRHPPRRPARRGSPVPAPPPAPGNRRRLAALQEAMTPRFKTDANGALVPDIRAAAAIIFNPETGQVLWEENAQDKRSIASITKVMTALVFLEDNPDLAQRNHRRARRRLRRLDDLSPRQRPDHARQRPAPHADRVRQRRGPRARPRLARRHRARSSSG